MAQRGLRMLLLTATGNQWFTRVCWLHHCWPCFQLEGCSGNTAMTLVYYKVNPQPTSQRDPLLFCIILFLHPWMGGSLVPYQCLDDVSAKPSACS